MDATYRPATAAVLLAARRKPTFALREDVSASRAISFRPCELPIDEFVELRLVANYVLIRRSAGPWLGGIAVLQATAFGHLSASSLPTEDLPA